MIRILADTSFLIAAVRVPDASHARAKELYDDVFRLIVPIFVFEEFLTFLAKKDGNEIAYREAIKLLSSDATVVFFRKEDLMPTLDILRKFDGLSYCDASNIVIMKELGITKILSFDSDFDLIPGIERMH